MRIAAIAALPTAGGNDCHLGSGCGFPAPNAEIFTFDPYYEFDLFGIRFSVDKPTILLLFTVIILVVFFWAAFAKPKLVPGKTQSIGELGYLFVRDQIGREIIGKDGDRFVPFLMALFFFVWMNNVWGIIPFAQFPVNSLFVFPVVLAVVVWLVYMYLGLRHQGPIKFFTNMMFPPGVPKPVYVLLAPIEFISNVIIRPFTLAIRLFANMFAGHLLLTIFTVAAFYLASPSIIGVLGSITSFGVTVILTGFEFVIQALQAYIFALLTAVYIAGSLHAEH